MVSASWVIINLMEDGVNQYAATVPVITLFGLLALLLERWFPFEKTWLHGSDWNLDFAYYIINYLIKISAQFALIWLAIWIPFPQWFPTSVPFWLQVLLALIIIDFFLFLVHWQSHRYEWLWKLHAIHHSSERLYFLNGEKRHALHQILEGSPGIILCLAIGTPQPVVVAALAVLAINMMMQHTNLDYKAGFLKKFFCVAELHRWHHRADYKDAQVNYGAWLTVWDYLFRTAYNNPLMNKTEHIGEIGIKEAPGFPRTYFKQMLYPFSKRIQQTASKPLMVIFLLLIPVMGFSQTKANDIVGTWLMEDGSKKIEVFSEDDRFKAKIVWVNNKDHQHEIGRIIMWNLTFDFDDREWSDGELQLPDMEHSASCFVKMADRNMAIVTGYHGLRFLGQRKKIIRM